MGVLKLFTSLRSRYPLITQPAHPSSIACFDNFYLDLNGLIHTCARLALQKSHNLNEITLHLFRTIEELFGIVKPKKHFFIAIDGAAPRAKMNEQRKRRFSKREVVTDADGNLVYDPNCVSPGTQFMDSLAKDLDHFIRYKIETDVSWQKCQVIFSDWKDPGEGEHKIMDFIRHCQSKPGYSPNETHCLFGADGDFLLLSLATHEPNFVILRENIDRDYNKNIKNPYDKYVFVHISILREYLDIEFKDMDIPFTYNLERVINDFILLSLFIGNDFLPSLPLFGMSKINGLAVLIEIYKHTIGMIGDYLTDEQGNIKFHHLESFLIAVGSKEGVLLCYKRLKSAQIKKEREEQKAKKSTVAEERDESEEEESDEEEEEEEAEQKVEQEYLDNIALLEEGINASSYSDDDNGEEETHETEDTEETSFIETPIVAEGTDEMVENENQANNETDYNSEDENNETEEINDEEENENNDDNQNQVGSEQNEIGKEDATQEEEKDEIKKEKNDQIQKEKENEKNKIDMNNQVPNLKQSKHIRKETKEEFILANTIEEEEGMYNEFIQYARLKHYRNFQFTIENENALEIELDELVASYIEGLHWVMRYYFDGCPNWRWFYPYYTAPFALDMENIAACAEEVVFPYSIPFRPFEQLMAILPPSSSHLLPEPYGELMNQENSPIYHLYHDDITSTTQLPFIDEGELMETLKNIPEELLSEDEIERNKFEEPRVYARSRETYTLKSPFSHGRDLLNCHVHGEREHFDAGEPFTSRTLQNVVLKYPPGIPTFNKLSFNYELKRIGIRVNGSRRYREYTWIIQLNSSSSSSLTNDTKTNSIPKINDKVYVGFPYAREGIVLDVMNNNNNNNNNNNTAVKFQAQGTLSHLEPQFYSLDELHQRFGIEMNEPEHYVTVSLLAGMHRTGLFVDKYYSSYGTTFPLQLTYPSHTQFESFSSASVPSKSSELPDENEVIFLGPHYFGATGIMSNKENTTTKNIKFIMPREYPQIELEEEKYHPLRHPAAEHNVSVRTITKILSSVKLEYQDQDRVGNEIPRTAELGLRLKMSRRGVCKCGYAKRVSNRNGKKFWVISEPTLELIQQYHDKFPSIFTALENNPDVSKASDVFPEDTNQNIHDIMEWLKTLPSYSVTLTSAETVKSLSMENIKQVEKAAMEFENANIQYTSVCMTRVSLSLVYNPLEPFPSRPKKTSFRLGNRVRNISSSGAVPFGLRGTVVGLHGQDQAEVVFDRSFLLGTTLMNRLSTRRGWLCSLDNLINLSIPQLAAKTIEGSPPMIASTSDVELTPDIDPIKHLRSWSAPRSNNNNKGKEPLVGYHSHDGSKTNGNESKRGKGGRGGGPRGRGGGGRGRGRGRGRGKGRGRGRGRGKGRGKK